MRSTECIPRARILALGGYQPTSEVGNHVRAPMVNTETVADMAAAAGAKALAAGGLAPGDIDLVIVATSTAGTATPNVSSSVAARLGMSAAAAFDINHACAGFSYALDAASGAVRAGTARHALVIGAEKHSPGTGNAADGAGAAVVGAVPGDTGPAIGPVIWGSDAAAATALPSVVSRACAATGIAPTELAAYVPHHADQGTVTSIGPAIGAPQARAATDYVSAGNAASVPLALTAMTDHGAIPSGAPVLLLEFGASLCYAAQVITAP